MLCLPAMLKFSLLGNTKRLFVEGQRLHSGLMVHLVCGCTVNRSMHSIVTVTVMRVFLYILRLTCCCFGELNILVDGYKQEQSAWEADSPNYTVKGNFETCLECKCMSEHHAVRLEDVLDDSICYTLSTYSLLCYSAGVCVDREHIWLKNCTMGHYTACLTSSISMSFDSILHKLSPFDRHRFLVSQPTTIGNWHLFDLCLEFLCLTLNCKAGRIRPSLNALSNVLTKNSQALWDDTCHPPSRQSCPHFTLTDKAWCMLSNKSRHKSEKEGGTQPDTCMRVN